MLSSPTVQMNVGDKFAMSAWRIWIFLWLINMIVSLFLIIFLMCIILHAIVREHNNWQVYFIFLIPQCLALYCNLLFAPRA